MIEANNTASPNKGKHLNSTKKMLIFLLIIIIALLAGLYYASISAPVITDINVINYNKDTNEITIKVNSLTLFGNTICYISETETNNITELDSKVAIDNTCTFTKPVHNFYIYLKKPNKTNYSKARISDYYNSVIDIISPTKIYLAVGETLPMQAKIISINPDNNITYTIENEAIAKMASENITGQKEGSTVLTITSKPLSKQVEIEVTSLINPPVIDNNRSFLSCGQYEQFEATKLDDILRVKIENAGFKTRAGVVEASRFLTLRFPYRVNYFIETGRLNNYDKIDFVDGEGRYYHRDLYLSEDKYQALSATKNGPAIWGCPLAQDNGIVRSNGFDCSGFINWVLYNGGFNFKDTGAGYTSRTDDLDDYGEKIPISMDLLKSGRVKAGDLINSNGHAAIIAGITDERIYIAESLTYNVGVTMLTYTYEELVSSTKFTNINLMDNVYKKDGNYTNIW